MSRSFEEPVVEGIVPSTVIAQGSSIRFRGLSPEAIQIIWDIGHGRYDGSGQIADAGLEALVEARKQSDLDNNGMEE